MECTYCMQHLELVSDARKLPCQHVGCFTCLSLQLKGSKRIECPTCKTEYTDVDVNSLERASVVDTDNIDRCNVCQESAVVFCVTCQMALCKFHKKKDQDEAFANSKADHYHVKFPHYIGNKEMYIIHYCKTHQERQTSQACVKCAQVFCACCDTMQKCPATDEEHDLTSLPDAIVVIRGQITDLEVALARQIARFMLLEKEMARKIEFIHKEKEQLIADLKKSVKDQIDHITQEGERLIAEICKSAEAFEREAKDFSAQLLNSSAIAEKQLNELEHIQRISLDGVLLETYANIKDEVQDMISRSYQPISIPLNHLSSTGAIRGLEIKLVERSCPINLEYQKSAGTEDEWYYSVKWISDDMLVTANTFGITIKNCKLDLIRSVELRQCMDIAPYKDQLFVLHWLPSDRSISIKLYSLDLKKIRDIVDFPTKINTPAQIAAGYETIVASDPENNCVYVWTCDGKSLTTINLGDMSIPQGVCITTDGYLLISCFNAASVIKYHLRGDYSLIWESDKIMNPWGIVEDEAGLLYVNRDEASNHSLYQLTSDGLLLSEVTCEQLKAIQSTHGISVFGEYLAVACRREGVKLFRFNYLK